MAKTEAQKQAQLKYLAAHPRKRLPVDMLPADYEKMIAIAKDAGVPPVTYIKRAISAQSGVSFSWDVKAIENAAPPVNDFPMNPPETGDTGSEV